MIEISQFSGLMPVKVFKGLTGNLVLCQEWPALSGERYLRVMVPMSEARQLADAIVEVLKDQRRRDVT